MSTYCYIAFYTPTYDTSKTYSSRLQILSKDNLLLIGHDLGLELPMSWSKEKMAEHISSHVICHPEEMIAMLDDEEIVLVHEMIAAGKQNVVWKRHLLKYHHLKKMAWVVVNRKSKGKDGFVMLDEIREAFTSFIEQRYETAKEKVKLAKKPAQPRFYLKDLKAKLDALDIEQLMYLHLLFEMEYMDHCDFWFRNEWFVDGYYDWFCDWYRDGCKEFPYQLNEMVFEILEEWKELGYKKYRPAMDSIKDWCTFEWNKFESVHQSEVSAAFEEAIVLDKERAVSQSLFPFIQNVHEYIRNKQYQEALSLIFCLFDHLGKASKKHEDWFDGFLNGGVQTSVVIFLDVLRHLYCHLRHKQDIPWQTKEAMDLRLMLTNKFHRLFGDLELAWGDSRLEDMLSDDSPYSDYSDMEDGLYDYLKKMVDVDEQI